MSVEIPLDQGGPTDAKPTLGWPVEAALCTAVLLSMAGLCVLQVLLRSLLHISFPWMEEVLSIGLVWFVFLGASLAVREGIHIRVLFLIAPQGSGRRGRNLVLLSDTVWAIVCAVLIYGGCQLVAFMVEWPYRSPVLGIDQALQYMAVPIGFTAMLARLVQKSLHDWRNGEEANRDH